MEHYLMDTNAISDYFSAVLPPRSIQFIGTIIDEIPNLSVISQIELLCWNTNKTTEQKVINFISESVVLNITSDVIKHCVSLRKNNKIKTPDAIIAATALTFNFTLITNNEKDFKKIRGLKIINPYNL